MLFSYLGGFLKHLGDRQICDSKFTFGVNVGVDGCLSYWKHCHELPEITDQIHPSIHPSSTYTVHGCRGSSLNICKHANYLKQAHI